MLFFARFAALLDTDLSSYDFYLKNEMYIKMLFTIDKCNNVMYI